MTPGAKSPLRALGSIELQTRRELIHARLREAISSGELTPGTHLAEVELSEALGVSRGTLREALRQLQQEGLLTADARGRLSVRVVTEREVEEIFAVRHALESLALELICAREDRAPAVARVRQELETLRDAEGDFTAQLDADLAFHERLCELSGNTTLLHSWRSVSGLARAAVTAAGAETAALNMAYERHAPIADLLEAGDAVGGREFLRTHMRDAATRIEQRMHERAGSAAG
ncbi:GntR family transcriptional regulator [Paenibacillus sp. TRM 82003]|uniref:GntR family transcriptional regulator n=1 Tax=Kineococcus sp. TRM81007 TaxID=2925831 RepID=UPI001F5AE6FC|nr:GntR family transcriptional regulator [Kineococcus sp. TRM81007]MCI2237366.1 GntR family transcriptional regulator [Kineococcus sp. TRM81007]MCI3926527.1 GntR family transcriptional regulator [Paenibacillus sp. TRM 82003]